tara:strand:- start:274 stop:537 length:264 start_codon:yes stop_codon:yes gene_type:complete
MNINIEKLKKTIEKLSKYHQVEIYSILKKSDIIFDENNNGSFINLSQLSKDIIQKLYDYTKYVEKQQKELLKDETEKNRLEETYFNN